MTLKLQEEIYSVMPVHISIAKTFNKKVEIHTSLIIEVFLKVSERLKSEKCHTKLQNFGSLRSIDALCCMFFCRSTYFSFDIIHFDEPTTSWCLLPFVVELHVSVVAEFKVDSVYY